MALVKTPRGIFEVFGARDKDSGEYPVTGYEIEYHLSWEGEGSELFQPKISREPATAEAVAALRGGSDETLTAQLQALNALVNGFRAEIGDYQSRLAKALDALRAVAAADDSWDNSPRSAVIAVLRAEA